MYKYGKMLMLTLIFLIMAPSVLAAKVNTNQGWIYYTIEQEKQAGLYRMQPDGSKKSKVIAANVTAFYFQNDKLYYSTYQNNKARLYYKNQQTGKIKEFLNVHRDECSREIADIVIIENNLYYSIWSIGGMNPYVMWYKTTIADVLKSRELPINGELITAKDNYIYCYDRGADAHSISKLNVKDNKAALLYNSAIYGQPYATDKLTSTEQKMLKESISIINDIFYYTPELDYGTEEYLKRIGKKVPPMDEYGISQAIYEKRINTYNIKTNKNTILTKDKVDSFTLYNNKIYYVTSGGNSSILYAMNLDGTNKVKIAELPKDRITILGTANNELYYSLCEEDNKLYKIHTNNKQTKVLENLDYSFYKCKTIGSHVIMTNEKEIDYLLYNNSLIALVP